MVSNRDFPIPQESAPAREQVPDARLAEHVGAIRKLSKRLIADVIEIGRRLHECKQLVGHGNWLPWLEREFRWSERTARNYISAFEFSQSTSANLADLGIDVGVAYLLASRSTPEEARTVVLRRLEAGQTLPHTEVKRIVGEARERGAAASTAKRRISINETIRERHGDFVKLPAIEREKALQTGPWLYDLAIDVAAMRQSWDPAFRELEDALDALETMAPRPPREIIAAIPVEAYADISTRIERAKNLLMELGAKLAVVKNVSSSSTAYDATRLVELLLKEARKTNKNKYERVDHAQLIEAIWTKLNRAQIALLRNGQFGPALQAIAERLMLKD